MITVLGMITKTTTSSGMIITGEIITSLGMIITEEIITSLGMIITWQTKP